MTRAQWGKKMWQAALDAQRAEIERKYGKKAAGEANYGWGDASSPGRIDIATKIYGRKIVILCTKAAYPSTTFEHSWE